MALNLRNRCHTPIQRALHMNKEVRLRMLNKKSILLTLLLIIGLTVPYSLKLLSPQLEPYPAIIFPAGPGKVKGSQDTFDFIASNIYCFDLLTKEWERQDTLSFLSPIPRQYFQAIVKNEFGLNPKLEHTVKFRKGIFPSFTYKNSSALDLANIDHAKAWLRDRLQQHGCMDSSLIVRHTRMSVDLATRVVSEMNVIDEKIFKL